MKDILANTPIKIEKLIQQLDLNTGYIGFDTEVVGPQLRGRDFVNISHSSLLGFSLAFEDGNAYYVPVRHKGRNASYDAIHKILARVQGFCKDEKVWAHNAKFDHQVLIREGYPVNVLLDSMIAAWLQLRKNFGLSLGALGHKGPDYDPTIAFRPGAEVTEYGCADARGTLEVGMKFLPELDYEWFREECYFAKILAECKLQGFRISIENLRDLRATAKVELGMVEARWRRRAPTLMEEKDGELVAVTDALGGEVPISITSSKQLQVLFEEGIWREHGRTSGGQFSTAREAMDYNVKRGRGDGKRLAQLRLDYQEVAKIVNTYTEGLIEEALQWSDHKLHPDLHHFGTVTGRLASANPNIQNQPAHGDWAKRVRECFIPDPGMEFTSADYSQIELRYFANYCGGELLQAFVDGKDLHNVTAEKLGVARQLGKTINFGFLLYGGGPRKMSGLLGCSEEEAKKKIALLAEGYPEIETWRKKVVKVASDRGPLPWVKTLAGRHRWIPELNPAQFEQYDPEGYTQAARAIGKKYGLRTRARINSALESRGRRLVVNYLVQGGSRDLLLLGMNEYRRRAPEGFSIATTVHDEVLTQHPIGRGEDARRILKESLEGAGPSLGLRVPVLAEPKTGSNWAEVK